jgi:hypothetical protein
VQWGGGGGSGMADKGCGVGKKKRLARFDYRAEHLSLSYPAMTTVETMQLYSMLPKNCAIAQTVHKCNVMCSVTDYRKN